MNDIPNRKFTSPEFWPLVIVESPFAGDLVTNDLYRKRACLDCLMREEVPFASHGFFTYFLDDKNLDHREKGITAGYAFWRGAAKIVFYVDLGWSSGMKRAKERAFQLGYSYEERTLAEMHKTTLTQG